jgi:hypothetical protein
MAPASVQAKRDAPSASDLRAALDDALRALDADERTGPLVRASGLSVRLELTDADLTLSVRASDDPAHHIAWDFTGAGAVKLVLQMDSATANAYLQGQESLAIAIARGHVQHSGESRTALLYLPVLRMLCEPYRRAISDHYPQLSLT